MNDYTIARATRRDRARIRRLVWKVGINPFGLRWQNFLVAKDGRKKLIGCGQLKPHGKRTIELASIAVEEEFRSRGVARAVIEELLAGAPRPLYLVCLPRLTRFYERFGFIAADTDHLPLHFRRIRRVARIIRALHRSRVPVIMRLD